MLKLADASHYQSAAAVAAALKVNDGLIAKATEGTAVDGAHAAHVTAARKARKIVGHYHYGWWGQPIPSQVATFLHNAAPLPGETLWADYEPSKGKPAAQWPADVKVRLAALLRFVADVSKTTGARCGIYTNKTEWKALLAAATPTQKKQLLAAPLWIAAPSDPAGKPAITTAFVLHQYGTVGGVDANVSPLTAASFRALGVPAKVAPKPAPAPAPKPAPKPAPVVVAPAPAPKPAPVVAPEVAPVADPLAGLHLPDLPRSVIRTVVPAVVGQAVSWLALAHVTLSVQEQDYAATGLGLALGAAYYAGVRAVERKWPSLGWLLGATGAPTYPTA